MTDVCFRTVSYCSSAVLQYDSMFRPFSRPIVSISRKISAFYVHFIFPNPICWADYVHFTATIGIAKRLFDYSFGFKICV